MALEAVYGGEHRERRYRRQPEGSRKEALGLPISDRKRTIGERVIHAFAHGRARAVMDDSNRLLYIQLLDPASESVIQEIPAEDLASNDYHGVFVDVET